jgi:propanediol utilization protein
VARSLTLVSPAETGSPVVSVTSSSRTVKVSRKLWNWPAPNWRADPSKWMSQPRKIPTNQAAVAVEAVGSVAAVVVIAEVEAADSAEVEAADLAVAAEAGLHNA